MCFLVITLLNVLILFCIENKHVKLLFLLRHCVVFMLLWICFFFFLSSVLAPIKKLPNPFFYTFTYRTCLYFNFFILHKFTFPSLLFLLYPLKIPCTLPPYAPYHWAPDTAAGSSSSPATPSTSGKVKSRSRSKSPFRSFRWRTAKKLLTGAPHSDD